MINSVLLIGLGKIGQNYDFDLPIEQSFLSHAGAIRNVLRPKQVYGIDTDSSARMRFTTKYGWDSFSNIDSLPNNFYPNLIVMALPTNYRETKYFELEKFTNADWLIEKPVCDSETKIKEVRGYFLKSRGSVFVNYQRRSYPNLTNLRDQLGKIKMQEYIFASGYVSGSPLSNVTHMVDLLNFLFEGRKLAKNIVNHPGIWSYHGHNCNASIINFPESLINIFRLDVFSRNHYWSYDSALSSIVIGSARAHPLYKNELIYSQSGRSQPSGDEDGLRFVYENLLKFFRHESYELCTLSAAIESMKLYY
jgi:predicted dehydrogenase